MASEIPENFWRGVNQFNQRDFYACHDTLESLWMEAEQSSKNFYQGILQISVALYHLGNNNWQGAVTLLGEGINRLRRYPSFYFEVDVNQLIKQSMNVLVALQNAGPEYTQDLYQAMNTASSPAIAQESSSTMPDDTCFKLVFPSIIRDASTLRTKD